MSGYVDGVETGIRAVNPRAYVHCRPRVLNLRIVHSSKVLVRIVRNVMNTNQSWCIKWYPKRPQRYEDEYEVVDGNYLIMKQFIWYLQFRFIP